MLWHSWAWAALLLGVVAGNKNCLCRIFTYKGTRDFPGAFLVEDSAFFTYSDDSIHGFSTLNLHCDSLSITVGVLSVETLSMENWMMGTYWTLFKRVVWIAMLISIAIPTLACAQVSADRQKALPLLESYAAIDFLNPYGIENFSEHYIDALSTLLLAEGHYKQGRYLAAHGALENLWSIYPAGDIRWGHLPTDPFGINIGSPPSYYALRMLTDTVEWRLMNPDAGAATRTARMTVVLVGSSNGIEPRNLQELQQGAGVFAQHTLDPLLLDHDSAVIHDSLRLFREYVVAMTDGDLDVDVRILHLPELDVSVSASVNAGRNIASISDVSEVWESLETEVMDETDWWWLIYPSHVPEQYSDFENAEFITGGMGVGPDSVSPLFIVDDRWLVRKPPHIGEGRYSKLEREAYLPQWLQHEFFHHLFRTYREFGLEEVPHQWFNRSTWPADFVGRYEPDYFHEALYKRLQGADTPLVSALRYSTTGGGGVVTLSDLAGLYIRDPAENTWHLGSILISPQLEWLNFANVRWSLQDDLENGNLLTGPDCPYFGTWGGKRFIVVWERDELGDELDNIVGFNFSGEFYKYISP